MWILRGPQGEEHYLTTNKVYTVSRKSLGDIVLANDESVSRVHARLEVVFDKEHVSDPARLPEVFLIECKSKYGTYVNKGISTGSRLPEEARLQLKNGDRVRFGIQHNEWKLHHEPLVVTTSTLNAGQTASLVAKVAELGGHVVPDWRDDCTHVTMNRITLTVKVVCALARGGRIVKPDYWEHYLSAVAARTALPDYRLHAPLLAERSLSDRDVSFAVDERRASLLRGKLFVFHSVEQLNAFSCMVFAAGGLCVIADGCGMSRDEMLEPHVVVMGYPFERSSQETQYTDSFKQLKGFLLSNGKRLISESEIGLAVLHCSVERYCNPQSTENFNSASRSQAVQSRTASARVATQEPTQPLEELQGTESSQGSFLSLRTKRQRRVAAIIVESDSEPEVVPTTRSEQPMEEMPYPKTTKPEETGSRKRLRNEVFIENPPKKLAFETTNQIRNVQNHRDLLCEANNRVVSNTSEVSVETPTKKLAGETPTKKLAGETPTKKLAIETTNQTFNVQYHRDNVENNRVLENSSESDIFRMASSNKSVFPVLSTRGQTKSLVSRSMVGSKFTSRRKSESSDEDKSLFTFIDDTKKSTARRRNDSDDEGSAMFTFVDEAQNSFSASRKRAVRNNSDSDDDNDAASKFVFVEDPSTKFAEKYFPDKTWSSNKRTINAVNGHDGSIDEPPSKRPSVESSRVTTNHVVFLHDFISAVKIEDEDPRRKEYASKLPDYVLGMNNTVDITVGSFLATNKADKENSVNMKNTSAEKNFKKFRKVDPIRRTIVPTIIGGNDLVIAGSQRPAVNGDAAGPDDRLESTLHFVDD
ncbi:nibrin [Bacillus rossius redtenbacheri]|uniref:nibrin n=1 Tax=Bacillus rossius redtenbacheri TaxID=93214 RepID=UPI002FDD6EDD